MIKKITLWLVCSAFFISNSFSRDLYSENDKKEFYSGIYNGCIKKQLEADLSNIFKIDVIPNLCNCYSKKFTEDLFGNLDFQIALSSKNYYDLKAITDKEALIDAVMSRFNSCLEKIKVDYGGVSKILKPELGNKSVTKIGLEGESRKSFEMSTTHACVLEVVKVGVYSRPTAEKYCSCTSKFMADYLSLSDLVKIISVGDDDQKFNKLSTASSKKCSDILSGKK